MVLRVITPHHLRPRQRDEERAAQNALRVSIDAVVVVGGEDFGAADASRANRSRVPLIHADSPSDLNAAWFRCCSTVSLVRGPRATAAQVAALRTALEQIR